MPYRTPRHASGYDSRPRGYRVCDNCGSVESPALQLKLCSQCKVTQYCVGVPKAFASLAALCFYISCVNNLLQSRDCQRSHWKSHEAVCKHTQAAIMGASSNYGSYYDVPEPSAAIVTRTASDIPPPDVAKHLRKFTSAHATILGWAGFQALDLKRMPSNIRKLALGVELSWRGGNDPGRRFVIVQVISTHLMLLLFDWSQIRGQVYGSSSFIVPCVRSRSLCRCAETRGPLPSQWGYWRRCHSTSIWANKPGHAS